MLRPVYTAAVRLLHALAAVAPAGGGKVARALRARRGLLQSYDEWARTSRDPRRPLLWVHAPSVGESLQALPVVALFRQRQPDIQIAYTFFSPSAEPFAASMPADFRAYLPFDHPRDVGMALDALRPSALVFCKADVWPNLVDAAAARGVRLGLISATLPARSLRLRPPAAGLLSPAFARLGRVGAVDAADAASLRRLGVKADRIVLTGDTRFDQVWARASGPLPQRIAHLQAARPTLVAGSTWPSDEDVLLRAVRAIRRAEPALRLLLAPHELTPSRLTALEQALSVEGATVSRLSGPAASDSDIVLVDSYGVLGDLYALAQVALVGGGFHRAGLHSVLEPAAFGVPVLFGPQHVASREARLLVAAGGAVSVRTAAELEKQLLAWLRSSQAREAAGAAAKDVVRRGLGAAERSYELVAGLLADSAAPHPP